MRIDSVRAVGMVHQPKGLRNGQAMIEYVIMMVLLLSATVVLSVFLYTYKQHSERVVNLVASEYP